MIPALISSVVILILYWRRKAEEKPAGDHATLAAVRSELGNLNARLDTLQKRVQARTY